MATLKIVRCSKCNRGDMIKLLSYSEYNEYWLSCDNCGYTSKAMNSKIDAVEAWNIEQLHLLSLHEN